MIDPAPDQPPSDPSTVARLGAMWIGLVGAALTVFALSLPAYRIPAKDRLPSQVVAAIIVLLLLVGVTRAARRARPLVRAGALAYVISVAAQIILTGGSCGLGVGGDAMATLAILDFFLQVTVLPIMGALIVLAALVQGPRPR